VVAFDGEPIAVLVSSGAMMPPRFLCDAMLGGLARWLRAAGYDATFAPEIEDGVLVRRAVEQDRILLSSDGGIFERNIVRDGTVRAVRVPRATPPIEQLAFVLRTLDLTACEPRCMACGGELREIVKQDAAPHVPPRSLAAHDRFWRCAACSRVYWHGTHWTRITNVLASLRCA
jgi:uncharacterized protein with PIN domain